MNDTTIVTVTSESMSENRRHFESGDTFCSIYQFLSLIFITQHILFNSLYLYLFELATKKRFIIFETNIRSLNVVGENGVIDCSKYTEI